MVSRFFDGHWFVIPTRPKFIYSRPIKKEITRGNLRLSPSARIDARIILQTCFVNVEQEHTLAQIHSDLLNFETTEVYFSAVCQQVPDYYGCLVIPAEDEK